MLNVKQLNDYMLETTKAFIGDSDVTAIEIYTVCGVPVELLTIEEERRLTRVISYLSGIKDYFAPGDFYFKNSGWLLIKQ